MSKKLVSLFLAVLMVFSAASVLAEGSAVTVTDMHGREITLAAPAEKIVVLMPADAEILWSLGVSESIVGVGMYCVTPEETAVMPGIDGKEVVNSGYVLNVEQILALAPQVVIMTEMGHDPDQVAALTEGGVQVVITNAQNLEDVYTDIALLGAVTGKNAEAETLITDMKARFAAIGEKAGETDKTLYIEESPIYDGTVWTAGKGTYMDDVAALCGLKNLFADLDGHQGVSDEQVVARNPDLIITTTSYDPSWMSEMPDAEIKNRSGWEGVTAVINGDVIYDPTNAVALPGPRLTDVAEMLLNYIQSEEAADPAA